MHTSKSRSPVKRLTETAKATTGKNLPPGPSDSLDDHPVAPSTTRQTSNPGKSTSKSKRIDHKVAGTDKISSEATTERPSRSKTVKKTVNQSTLNKSTANQLHPNKSTENSSIHDKSGANKSTHSKSQPPTYLIKNKRVSMSVKDGEKHFYCDSCEYVAKKHRWNLTRHVKLHHPNEEPEHVTHDSECDVEKDFTGVFR